MSRILLIDDDLQVSEVLHTSIEILGHTVKSVGNSALALAAVTEFHPDLTLVDMMMPGLSGMDLLKEMQATRPEVISCLTTGLADPKLLEQALKAGGWYMLTKPFNLSELMDLLGTAELLSSALKMENANVNAESPFVLTHDGAEPVTCEDLAKMVSFAHDCQADNDVADRRLPITAAELLRNAWEHGVQKKAGLTYGARLTSTEDSLKLEVFDSGRGFDWKKALVKTRVRADHSRAAGLQIVNALADEFEFDSKGNNAFVLFAKHAPSGE